MLVVQGVDGETLLLLNQADMMRQLQIKLGPAIKVHNSIVMMKNSTPAVS